MERRRRGVDPLVMSPDAPFVRWTSSSALVALVALVAVTLTIAAPVHADDAPAASASAAPEIPLPELPELRSADLPKAAVKRSRDSRRDWRSW